MNTFINYLLEANLGLIFSIVLYRICLTRETQFSFKRFYLLGAIVFSLTFPLFHFNSIVAGKVIPSVGQALPSYWLPEAVVGQPAAAVHPGTVWPVLEIIYWAIVTLFTLRLLIRLGLLFRLILSSEKYGWRGCRVAESAEVKPTFSFFRFIFIGQSGRLSNSEKEGILRHEEVHARKFHSLDLLLINAVGCVFWFNPVVYAYRRHLVQLHEFEADACTVVESDTDTYCGLLAKLALQSSEFSLANHFNNSLTVQRITMMKTTKTKISTWKVVSLIPASVILFFAVACQEQTLTDLKDLNKNSATAAFIPAQVRRELEALQKSNPDEKYVVIQMNEEGEKTLAKLGFENAETNTRFPRMMLIQTEKDSDGGGFTYAIIGKDERLNAMSGAAVSGDSVYAVVDDMPEYVGGFDSLVTYLNREMKYPVDARKAGIQGKVFVSFVVSKEGHVEDVTIAKGVADDIDREALRVVSAFPEWKPGRKDGKAVNAKFVLPINFKL